MEDNTLSDFDFCKKYKVIIEKSHVNPNGYKFGKVDEFKNRTKFCFTLTYYFEMYKNNRNPVVKVDNVDGNNFDGINEIIKHFKDNYALKHAVCCDGLIEKVNV
jgi:hypothetical protein